MQLFYHKDIEAGGICTLDVEESRHAVKVLRCRVGDTLWVTNGRGEAFGCQVVVADGGGCVVEASAEADVRFAPPVSIPRLHLAVAPTKNPSRMEWLVEKAVELGVDEVSLLHCEHSERGFLKTDRLEKLAVSAMKQSLHTLLPRIHPTVDFAQWIERVQEEQRLIAHCEEGKVRKSLPEAMEAGKATVVLIGPEGDFSPAEIAMATKYGFLPVSLGRARLRTETAALYAVAAFHLINGEG